MLRFRPFVSIQGETPLHTACRHGLANLTAELLQQGANPNLQTEEALPLPKEAASLTSLADSIYLQTPLHMAIAYNHPDVVSVILEQKGKYMGILSIVLTWGQRCRIVSYRVDVSSVGEFHVASFLLPKNPFRSN